MIIKSPWTLRQCPSLKSQRVLQILVSNWNCLYMPCNSFLYYIYGRKSWMLYYVGRTCKATRLCMPSKYVWSEPGQPVNCLWKWFPPPGNQIWLAIPLDSPPWRPILLHLFFSRVMLPLFPVFSQAGVSPVDRASVLSHTVSQQHAWSWTWAAPMFVCKCMNEMA